MSYEYVPPPYEIILLAVATFRLWRVLAEDDILDRPRGWLLRLPSTWQQGEPVPAGYRDKTATFITCPWCLGLWVALGFYLAWLWQPQWTLVVATVGTISAAVGLIRSNLDAPE